MSFVVLDFPDVLVFSPPCAFFLGPCLEHTQEVFLVVPEIEAFIVEHVVFEVAEVVLVVLEDLEGQSCSPSIFECSVVDVAVDPDSLEAQFPCDHRGLLQAVSKVQLVAINSDFELLQRVLHSFLFLLLLHHKIGVSHF